MSILYDQELVEWDGGSSRPTAIKQFVLETPDTLHVVPAGNGNLFSGIGYNIDEIREKNALIPAMLEDENVLVVGAINSNYLKYEDYPNYKMTKFSNFGEFSVDVLAPGQEFCGLKIGAVNGSSICKSGTSFASPFTLNHVVLKIHEINPDLSIAQIKEIVLKTVYVKDLYNPFPVRSGGIIHPARAGRVARYLKGKDVTVEQAVLNVRENEKNEILTEKRDSEFLSALVKFWHKRKI